MYGGGGKWLRGLKKEKNEKQRDGHTRAHSPKIPQMYQAYFPWFDDFHDLYHSLLTVDGLLLLFLVHCFMIPAWPGQTSLENPETAKRIPTSYTRLAGTCILRCWKWDSKDQFNHNQITFFCNNFHEFWPRPSIKPEAVSRNCLVNKQALSLLFREKQKDCLRVSVCKCNKARRTHNSLKWSVLSTAQTSVCVCVSICTHYKETQTEKSKKTCFINRQSRCV